MSEANGTMVADDFTNTTEGEMDTVETTEAPAGDDTATTTAAPPVKAKPKKKAAKKPAPVKVKAKPATPAKKAATTGKKPAAKPGSKAKAAATVKAAAVPAKKAETKAKTTHAAGADKQKSGLRKPQIKVLECLDKKDGLTRAEIATKTGVDQASLTGYIGPVDPVKRKYNDETYFVTLVTLGYVKHELHEGEGITHKITAAGRKALEKIKATAAK